jgi:hypothetical protein
VKSGLEVRLTELLRVKYDQNKEKRAVFINVTTVLPSLWLVRDQQAVFSRSG